jgi:hypothetical protein
MNCVCRCIRSSIKPPDVRHRQRGVDFVEANGLGCTEEPEHSEIAVSMRRRSCKSKPLPRLRDDLDAASSGSFSSMSVVRRPRRTVENISGSSC